MIKSVTEMAMKYKDDCCCRIFLRLKTETKCGRFCLRNIVIIYALTCQCHHIIQFDSIAHALPRVCVFIYLIPEYNKGQYVAKRSKHKKKSTSVLIKCLGYDHLRVFHLKKHCKLLRYLTLVHSVFLVTSGRQGGNWPRLLSTIIWYD